jgi:hypothetical protein
VKISRRERGAPAGANELTRRERKSAGANEAPQARTESPVGANVGAPAGANCGAIAVAQSASANGESAGAINV